jgi:hypothetical protein
MKLSIFLGLTLMLGGCMPGTYKETHHVPQMRVVFMDKDSIKAKFRRSTHAGTTIKAGTLQGFYDYPTRTIYCPKMAFAICGHELHHAILGDFHK